MVGTEVPRSSATSGSSPIITNSVVPMPKALTASASRARGMRRDLSAETPVPPRPGRADGRKAREGTGRDGARPVRHRCRTPLVPERNKFSQTVGSRG